VKVELEYRSLPVHREFHVSMAYERTLFGGYGSGKSWALCAEALAVGLEQPGSEILICRKTIPSLRDTTEAIFTSLIPSKLWDQCETRRMGNHYESILLPNGTKYMFRGLDDWMKLKSLSLAYIFYDEADEIDEDTYVGMMSRVRQRQPTAKARTLGAVPITRRGIVCAANPAGHNWLWRRFVSEKDKAPNTEWFKSTSLDNPYLPLTYIDSLLAMPDPWVRRYVMCDFDEFGGQIYEDWGHEHMVEPYLKAGGGYAYPPEGLFVMGFDPGTASGNAAVWCFYDKEKARLVGIAEYNETGLGASAHAQAWRRIEAQHRMRVNWRVADPKALPVRDRGSNMGLDQQYARLGFHFNLGPNSIDTRVHSLGQLIFQRRFVVTRECPRLFEQLQNYRWEDLTPQQRAKGTEAKPLKKDVDLVDAAQYIASRYIAPPKVEVNRSEREQDGDEIRAAIRRQLANRTATRAHDLGSLVV
jgi:PBSX family phage terminase large subunit